MANLMLDERSRTRAGFADSDEEEEVVVQPPKRRRLSAEEAVRITGLAAGRVAEEDEDPRNLIPGPWGPDPAMTYRNLKDLQAGKNTSMVRKLKEAVPILEMMDDEFLAGQNALVLYQIMKDQGLDASTGSGGRKNL